MNVLRREKQVAVVVRLLQGVGVKQLAREVGISDVTATKYAHLLRAGELASVEAEARRLLRLQAPRAPRLPFADRCLVLGQMLAAGAPDGNVKPDDLALLLAFGEGCRKLHGRLVRDIRATRLLGAALPVRAAVIAEPRSRLVIGYAVGSYAIRTATRMVSERLGAGCDEVPVQKLDEPPLWLSALAPWDAPERETVLAALVTAWNFAGVSKTGARPKRSPASIASLAYDLSLEELVAVVLYGADPNGRIKLPPRELVEEADEEPIPPTAPSPRVGVVVRGSVRLGGRQPAIEVREAPALPVLPAGAWVDFTAVGDEPGVEQEEERDDGLSATSEVGAAAGRRDEGAATPVAGDAPPAPERGGDERRVLPDGARGPEAPAPPASGRAGDREGAAPGGDVRPEPRAAHHASGRESGEADAAGVLPPVRDPRPGRGEGGPRYPAKPAAAPAAVAHVPPPRHVLTPPRPRRWGRRPSASGAADAGPTLPLRPLVAALRAAHPAMTGLDDLTAADLTRLSASQRRVLEARYLAEPGRVVTFAAAAARLAITRAGVHFVEKAAFQALGLAGATVAEKGRRPARERPARVERGPGSESCAAEGVGGASDTAADGSEEDEAPRQRRPPRKGAVPGDPPARPKLTHRAIAGDAEAELIRRYQGGDQRAGALLLEAHAGLIAMYALKYRGRGLDDDDLIQEGRLGFLRAVEKFDASLGFKLATYAKQWIQQRAQRAISETGHAIPVPVHVDQKLGKARRSGIDMTAEAIAGAGLLREDRAACALAAKRIASLDAPVGEEDSTLLDFLPGADPGPDARYEEAERLRGAKEKVETLLASLTQQERTIVLARFATEDGEEETLIELGRQFGLSRERIRQLQVQALRKMRWAAQRQDHAEAAVGHVPLVPDEDPDDIDEEVDPEEPEAPAPPEPPSAHAPSLPPPAAATLQPRPAAVHVRPPLEQRLRGVVMPDGRTRYDVVEMIAALHGRAPDDVASRSRFKPFAKARGHVWWWLKNEAGASYTCEFIAHVWGFSIATVIDWIGRHAYHAARGQVPGATKPTVPSSTPAPSSRVGSAGNGGTRIDAWTY